VATGSVTVLFADVIIGIAGFDLSVTPTTKIIRDAGQVKFLSGAGL